MFNLLFNLSLIAFGVGIATFLILLVVGHFIGKLANNPSGN